MTINYFDVGVLCILGLFTLQGLLRGFVGEVAGVAALIAGFLCAHRAYQDAALYLTAITDPTWRNIVAYVLVFLAVLIAVGLLARLLRKVLAFSFISWIDKLAGGALGLLKGSLICSLLLILFQRFLGETTFMHNSVVLPYLNAVMEQLRNHLPADLITRLNF
ncbi:MAG: CvpA family protein [Desulfovibrionaceae bacterium]|nr:CvpA family protein [Desulfovibrionaceae bacterium]